MPEPAPAQLPGMDSGQPPDLSTMTPREAADRLFNRIMIAVEQGNNQEALKFAPMAVQAYGLLEVMDADAHYHLGRIHAVVGNLEGTREQIARLKQLVPGHLLAYILEHLVAAQVGDKDTAALAYMGFSKAYDAEITSGRREYGDHRTTIEKFRAASGGAGANFGIGAFPR